MQALELGIRNIQPIFMLYLGLILTTPHLARFMTDLANPGLSGQIQARPYTSHIQAKPGYIHAGPD